ncbi:hypothetical protein Acr_19g0005310 [Actinidia rufa]|uniref:Uncharacterized protein n=1 Tax=Actinidia rufa TaxID=165716 RepID=A0A7J0G9W9_9ERIC|nr:hypothetical protein Acr_19g0005310 [Actinidia rufa]
MGNARFAAGRRRMSLAVPGGSPFSLFEHTRLIRGVEVPRFLAAVESWGFPIGGRWSLGPLGSKTVEEIVGWNHRG